MGRAIFSRLRLLLPFGLLLLPTLLLTAACRPALLEPPRLATAAAETAATATPTVAPLQLPAPTATADPLAPPTDIGQPGPGAPTLTVWINETSPAHEAALQEMMTEFSTVSGVNVALQLVAPDRLPDLVNTAVLSDTLPDVILHPLEYTVGWTERGIFDPAAADAVIDEIGRDTFDAAALELVDVNGQTAAVPSDGYQQVWLYRSDWFDEAGLAPPDSYEAMLTAAETLYDLEESLVSGLVIPTESNLITTHRAFEHLAIANGCQLIDDQGEVLLLEPACRDALNFYFSIVNQFSPPGVQTDTSARNAFLDGRTSMIVSSPGVLLDVASIDDLVARTGILTQLTGRSETAAPQNFGNVTYLGITPNADPEAAAAFARYWFNEGYEQWLAVDAERKVPMRLGTAEAPRRFIDAWGTTPLVDGRSLSDIYGREVVEQLRSGIAASQRWGFRQGQGALITRLYENLTFSIVLQEMLSGYFSSAKTIFEAMLRVVNQIPNYPYEVPPTSTPLPT